MSREEKNHIVIAETSPVLSSGFSQCIRRIPGLQANIIEVKTTTDLQECAKASSPDIIIVNPAFGGIFNPVAWKEENNAPETRIVAIETGKLNPQAASLFDEVISVIDDLDTISRKIKSLCISSYPNEEKESLSNREKEIISHVVRGLTNQEIADKLFLSIHTVITHRRNIARKLEIHSATGLTIYAIVNKIVDIADIKL
ncbi:MAG: response regulator transcription factor [Muribaculaceae bacterium]|nr:response regulator transcription factor [Muribaculaceae bacterium]